ncbi:hypothetical protein AB0I02_20400 [Streptomyces phaeochromogenes]
MTTTRETDVRTLDEEEDAPSLGALLLASAVNPRDRAAVRALVDEELILARDHIRTALVVKTTAGRMGCDWERFGKRLYTLGLDEGERAFLDLVLSLAGPHRTSRPRPGARRPALGRRPPGDGPIVRLRHPRDRHTHLKPPPPTRP